MLAETRSILIYGMGMMGASLAAALRAHEMFTGRITGVVRTERSARFLYDNGLADELFVCARPEEAARIDTSECELVVIGVPVGSVGSVLVNLPPFDGIVTDMSSTRRVVETAASKRPDLRFVGSHPMCGSEDSGPSAFRPGLLANRLCIITPRNSTREVALEARHEAQKDAHLVAGFWEGLGMQTYFLNADTHDRLAAFLSHTPHVLSGMLTLWAQADEAVALSLQHSPQPVTGGGFKDMARIAGSNPEMWADIIATNGDFILESLQGYVDRTQAVMDLVRGNDREAWLRWFKEARLARNRLCGYPEDM